MQALLRRLTVEQWQTIDDEYREAEAPRAEAMWVLVAASASLILSRYWGQRRFITGVEPIMAWFATLPQSDIYPYLYWGAFKLVNYLLVPALCIKLVLKRRIVDFGLVTRQHSNAWPLYFGMLAIVIPLVYGVSFTEPFLRTYPKYKGAADSLWGFFAWEFIYALQFFLLEYFFRGFLLFSLARHMGSLSIFVMVVPYAMIHFGKPVTECVGSVLAGIALGTIALRTRTIYGGVVVHCGVAWSMDLFALMQKGKLSQLWT
ncbi:MAG: CPBP family intramembrane metalloprotease [Myxococcales bacterium]|nr:CPBP family intramembrane metalloprotease [Myxococcales bacterium]